MKILVICIVMFLYLLMNYYIGNNIFNLLKLIFKAVNIYAFYIIFGLLVISSIISLKKIPGTIGDIVGYIGAIYIGLFIYLFLLFLFKDIIRLIIGDFSNTIKIISSSLIVGIALTLAIYGAYNATQIKKVVYDIKDDEFKNKYNIVLVSDIHLGSVGSERNLLKIITKINELNPDLVCVVGDLFTDNFHNINNPELLIKEMKKIRSTYGVYMSLGNHDGGSTYNEMVDFIEKSEIKLLNDDYTIINNDFVLLGRIDGTPIGGFDGITRKETKNVLEKIEENLPIIVMDHNPINIKEYDADINLLLSGHTHKGQIFPANLITDKMYVVDYGLYNENVNYPVTIVSSGAGTWGMPMRIGSHSEVVLIKLNK